MPQTFTIWCNYKLVPALSEFLQAGVRPHRLAFASTIHESNLVSAASDDSLKQADIAFGQPDPAAIIALPKLKWIHLTSAGYERYDRADVRDALRVRGAVLTNSSSVYDEPCAEHLLAFMLAHARQLPLALHNQWNEKAWPAHPIRPKCRLLTGQTALVLGYGAIARRLIELLAPLKMNVIALRRRPTGDETIPTHLISELPKLLPQADHILNTLPGGRETTGIFNAACFPSIKPGATFYNIGRGSTVDQDALLNSLRTGQLVAAYLDVMTPEPLPTDHPLWTQPNCYITPHSAGGHDNERERLVEHFLANLRQYETGKKLADIVFA